MYEYMEDEIHMYIHLEDEVYIYIYLQLIKAKPPNSNFSKDQENLATIKDNSIKLLNLFFHNKMFKLFKNILEKFLYPSATKYKPTN